ncbi:3'-5' exonuclease [Zooshikella harenae]|uniref:Exonuclease domain-containing protein n=1 Tax=Zooshikella harenae TaxID=2827238 RepID=A0ABS5Z8G9_9GAMM|nr:3'-5' exonuclease [Zooshikella harenae]MBU2709606.1 exonuclease domain-containing protein [Zooshikella harenae]
MNSYKYYLIIDLEATCCNQKTIARNQMEIIEIGAVLVDAKTLTIIDEFQTFICPVRNPVLTAFCTELTSITQKDVDNAPGFSEAIKKFRQWLQSYHNYVFCSWGDYDKKQFEQDCQFHQVAYPLASGHINIKKAFSTTQGFKRKYGMSKALKLIGAPLEGTHHRGIDDARNMVKLMPFVLEDKN